MGLKKWDKNKNSLRPPEERKGSRLEAPPNPNVLPEAPEADGVVGNEICGPSVVALRITRSLHETLLSRVDPDHEGVGRGGGGEGVRRDTVLVAF